jgi:hypothetical protein
MSIRGEPIPVDQRAVFWKVEHPGPRIAWLMNLCQDHATSGDGSSYLGLRSDASNFHPAEPKVEQACESRVSEIDREHEPGLTFNSFPVLVKPCS